MIEHDIEIRAAFSAWVEAQNPKIYPAEWQAFQAGWQAALAAQPSGQEEAEDAERYRWLRSFNSGDVRVVDITTNTSLFMHTADATIDHARRIEREWE